MTITMNGKEYDIKFENKETAKAGLVSKIVKIASMAEDSDDIEMTVSAMEKAYLILPEMLLVGLQHNYREEFGYVTNAERANKLAVVEAMLEHYVTEEEQDYTQLFSELQEELLTNGFLAQRFKALFAEMEATNKNNKK